MSWWLATFGAQKDVYQAASASAAQARHPTWTIAGPYSSKAAAQGNAPSAPAPSGSSPAPSGSTGCGAKAIYQALLSAGFSTAQAIGAMANAIAESTLNPEARALDTNGAYSNGLWQFNEVSYPDSGSLVTGNCAADITSQVGYLKSHVSGAALQGATGAEVASNFAASFERCQGCGAGGSQNAKRTANAATVEGWISSGNWPTSTAGISPGSTGTPGATLTGNTSRCLVGGGSVFPCLIDASQARALIGGACILAGGLMATVGLVLLMITAGGPAEKTAKAVPGVAKAARFVIP